jgi:hypothetical protein
MLPRFAYTLPVMEGYNLREADGAVVMSNEKTPASPSVGAAAKEVGTHISDQEHYTGTSVEGLVDFLVARRMKVIKGAIGKIRTTPDKPFFDDLVRRFPELSR